jgi:UDP-N-acetylglucosamine acyltransferase
MNQTIHPTAVVDATAIVGAGVVIHPYACVGAGVVLGAGCVLSSHAVVHRGSVLGDGVLVDSFAVIGGDPQMNGFDPATLSGVIIGAHSRVREGVTVHRGSAAGRLTSIGDHVHLMAGSHVGHDCIVHSHATLANNVMLAGHVEVGEYVFLGGGAGVHQFVRIGEGAMVGGNASISYDIPPFTMAAQRNEVYGLNLIGLKRRHFSAETIADLKSCFRAVYSKLGDVRVRAEAACLATGATEQGRTFLRFFAGGRRGFATLRRAELHSKRLVTGSENGAAPQENGAAPQENGAAPTAN